MGVRSPRVLVTVDAKEISPFSGAVKLILTSKLEFGGTMPSVLVIGIKPVTGSYGPATQPAGATTVTPVKPGDKVMLAVVAVLATPLTLLNVTVAAAGPPPMMDAGNWTLVVKSVYRSPKL